MQPRIIPEAQPQSILHKYRKLIIWGIVLVASIWSAVAYFIPQYRYYYVPEELPHYKTNKSYQDDTLRIALIGDSWADYHTSLSGDTIIANIGRKIYENPIKAVTRGKKGALTKEVYFFMFSNKTTEHAYEPDRCTQPIIEDHPDYCVVFAGINDVNYLRTTKYYTENIRLIINLLLHNDIRPVIMEIPLVDFTEAVNRKRLREQLFYKIRSIVMGTINNEGTDYQKALKQMLSDYKLQDSVLYISAKQWNPEGAVDTTIFLTDQVHLNFNGYHKLDSCITTEVINDYRKRRTTRQSSISGTYTY